MPSSGNAEQNFLPDNDVGFKQSESAMRKTPTILSGPFVDQIKVPIKCTNTM